MKLFISLLLLLFISVNLFAGNVFTFEKTLSVKVRNAGRKKDNSKEFVTKRFSIVPYQKYELSFHAKINGPDTLEENPVLEYYFYDRAKFAKGKFLPTWTLVFYDKNNKICPAGVYGNDLYRILMHKDKICRDIFYAPIQAKSMEIIFKDNGNGDNKIEIRDLQLKKSNEKYLNINGNFHLGEYNLSGYRSLTMGKIIEMENGNFAMYLPDMLLPKQGSSRCILDPIPVKTGKRYRIRANVRTHGKHSRLFITFLDKNFKRLNMLRTKVDLGKNKEGILQADAGVPEKVSYIAPMIRQGTIRNIIVEEIKE